MPRVGLNPYALGMRLFYFIEEMVNKGKLSWKFELLKDTYKRDKYNVPTSDDGRSFIFAIRENFNDFQFINQFVNQDFITKNDLFVAGRRLNEARRVWEYYVKSRNAGDYRNMLLSSLYHPLRSPSMKTKAKKQKHCTLSTCSKGNRCSKSILPIPCWVSNISGVDRYHWIPMRSNPSADQSINPYSKPKRVKNRKCRKLNGNKWFTR